MNLLSSLTVSPTDLAAVSFETWLQFLGRLHPLVLHAPIGLLIGLSALEFFALIRRHPLPTDIRAPLTWLVALSAIVSVASGLALSQEQSSSDTLQIHQWLAIAVAVAALLAALLLQRRRLGAYTVFLLISLGLLVPAGHFGASMTHGPDFLTEPFARRLAPEAHVNSREVTAAAPVPAPSADPRFTATVLPIFTARCTNCHGERRQKGGLALDTLDAVLRGGKNGQVVILGSPDESELLVRLKLPLDDDDHMPPPEKPQLTTEEIAAIEAWIKSGPAPSGSAASTSNPPSEPSPLSHALPAPASPETLAALTTALIHVEPVSQTSPLLVIDTAAVAASTTDETLSRLLSDIKPNIADLSLARTKITDASAPILAGMKNLRRLSLTATAITNSTLAALANHPALEDLTLARTKISDTAALASIPHLKHLYVWSTNVSPESLADLSAKRPDLIINSGAPAPDPVVEAETSVKFSGDLPPPGAVVTTAPAPTILAASNTTCPVSGAPINPDRVILYKGKLIAFCCEKCAAQFWAEPEKFADKVK